MNGNVSKTLTNAGSSTHVIPVVAGGASGRAAAGLAVRWAG